jgi:CRP/FNR family cyclic AMP-dependent transcriptional regulator
MASRRSELIRLFEFEPDLLGAVAPDEAAEALARTVVEAVSLPRGEFAPPAVVGAGVDLGFLVLEGLLVHRRQFAGRRAVELIGPGDLVRPWRDEDAGASVSGHTSWKVCEPVRLAKLDRAFERDAARWPGLHARLLDRLDARFTGLALQLALAQQPRLETRLLWLFWHLADRWGRVERQGVVVHLRISQSTLADLVSARRPSVSHALAGLREQGLLLQSAPGRWELHGEVPRQAPDIPAHQTV